MIGEGSTLFTPNPPEKLTPEMAEGIGDITQYYIRYGVSQQRLQKLARDKSMTVVEKWQSMMEIFLTTQLHTIAGLGYSTSEEGLTQYAQDLADCLQNCDETLQELFRETRRDTWRELVATAFDLNVDDIPTLSIVDARNLMHQVSSKMVEPDVLLEIQKRASTIKDSNPQKEMALKHQVLQDIIVNSVYLGSKDGNKSLVEQAGFGAGEEGYAMMQCSMSDHEGDPLIAQYASAAMVRIWESAGLDINALQQNGGTGA